MTTSHSVVNSDNLLIGSNDADEISIGTDDSHDADEVKAINVENAFMDEKKAAVFALRAICKHTGQAFLPYLYQG